MILKPYRVRITREIEVKGYSESDARELALAISEMDNMLPVIEVELLAEAERL